MKATDCHIKGQILYKRGSFKRSPQKQDLVQATCSRHLQCLEANIYTSEQQNDSISINEDMLKQIEPQVIATEPVFEFQAKPEVDLLAKINTRKRKLETLIHNHEQRQQLEHKKQSITKVNQQAKELIKQCKKVPQSHPATWGHSPFVVNPDKENQQSTPENQGQAQVREKPPIDLKPINQRILEYKTQQKLIKLKSAQNFKRPHREDINVQQCNQKIQKNAEKVLQEIKAEREKAEQDKRIIQAKIRALQIQSLKKVAQAKKKPLESSLQFNLGDSVYSTFDARAEGRRKIKQNKIKKQVKADPSLLQTKQPKYLKAGSKQPRSTPRIDKAVDKSKKAKDEKQPEGVRAQRCDNAEALQKGPFFIWNIPILPEDVSKLQAKSQDVFMNVDRFNYKSGKTFREEANQYLAQKMEKKMQIAQQEFKQQRFIAEVNRKKQILDRQFFNAQASKLEEVFWNEDDVFRPNLLSNFHFYARQTSADHV